MRRVSAEKIQVGEWLVHPRQNRISRPDRETTIEPKVMEVLLVLADSAGEAVTRDELLDSAWQGAVVTDDAIARVISALRRALDDDSRNPEYIETIRKTGYRLIAPVIPAGSHGGSGSDGAVGKIDVAQWPDHADQSSSAANGFRKRAIMALAFAATAVVVLVLILRQPGGSISPWSDPAPVTTQPGLEIAPAVAPGGGLVAYTRLSGDGSSGDIHVSSIDESSDRRLTDHPARDNAPAWSPDGGRIAFVRRSAGKCSIMVVPAVGGPERQLGSCNDTDYADLVWSADGSSVAFNDRFEQADPSHAIVVMDVESGERTRVTTPEPTIWGDYDPAFSPDGSRIAFARARSEGLQDLFVTDVSTGAVIRLTRDARNLYGHVWAPDGSSILFSSNRGGTYDLWRIGAHGGGVELVLSDSRHLVNPSLSSDGRSLVYEQRSYDVNLYASSPDNAEAPLVPSTRWEMIPSFSPDGMHLAFASNRSGTYEIWTSDADGDTPVRLTSFDGPFTSNPSWSPDGRYIVFDSRPNGHADVFVAELSTGHIERLTDDPADDIAPVYSADGSRILFGSNRGGAHGIWSMQVGASSGAPVQLVPNAYAGRESPDGEWIWFTRWGDSGLWRIPAKTASSADLIIPDLPFSDWGNWYVADRGVYYTRRADSTIAFHDIDTRTTRTVMRLDAPLPPADRGFTVGPDGRFVFARIDGRESDIIRVERTGAGR